MNKYKIPLEKILKLLEDEELIKIEKWVRLYNEQWDDYSPIDVIDRMVEVNNG